MEWYNKLTIGKKIVACFLLVACVAGLSGIFSTGVIWDVTKRGSLMYTSNLIPIRNLTEVVKGYQTSLAMLRDIIIDKSPQEQNEHRERLKQADDKVAKGLEAFFASNRSAEATALQKQITEDLQLYGYFRDKVVELSQTDRRDEAVNIMRNQGSDVIDRLDGNIAKIMAINEAQALNRYNDNSLAARRALAMNLICLTLGVVSAVALGYFLHRGISTPLRQLTETVGSVTEGNLTGVIGSSYPPDSRNELHILSRNIDQMTATLGGIITRIATDSRQLFSASGTLNQTSESMAQRADTASIRISDVSVSSEEVNLTAAEIARNCSTAAANVSLASDRVGDSQRIMAETVRSMQSIGDHVRDTAQVISHLGQKSIQIGEITSTINDIADQTNLLALNAAIEAARAGEHGRGFAVVADEVRALAARTTRATGEISAMIQAIQNEANRAVAAMGNGVAEVEEGTLMVARTDEALKAITDIILAISSEVGHITTAAEEQSASLHGITQNIQQVSAIIEKNVDGTQKVATAATGLNTMAGDLQDIVGRFKLDNGLETRSLPEETYRGYGFPDLAAAEA